MGGEAALPVLGAQPPTQLPGGVWMLELYSMGLW